MILDSIKKYFLDNIDFSLNRFDEKRLKFFLSFSFIGIPALVIFGLVNIIRFNPVAGIVELLFAVLLLFNIYFIKKSGKVGPSIYFALSITLLVFDLLFVTGGIGNTGMFWFYIYPVLAYFLDKRGRAHLWIITITVSFIALFLMQSMDILEVRYSNIVFIQFLASFIAVSYIVYFAAELSHGDQETILSQNKALQEAQISTEKSLIEAENKSKNLIVSLQDLEDTKKATLNILEDLEIQKKHLAEEKAKAEALLSSIGDGVVATDEEGKIIFINESALKILDAKADDIKMGDVWGVRNVVVSDIDNNVLNKKDYLYSKAIKSQKSASQNLHYRFGKKEVPVAVNASPVVIDGVATGVIVVFHDITHEREIDQAKTEFVSLASHQLRTPLSTIGWYTEMLLAGDAGALTPNQKKYLDEIYTGNHRMVDLVNALLNVSRLELGTFTIEPEEVSVVDTMKAIMKEISVLAKQKSINLDESYADNIPIINADPKLLTMVFQNLLSNAVKYTKDKGRVLVDISMADRGVEIGGKKINKKGIVVVVEDDGYGIPNSQHDKIFSKLFRADNVRAQDTQGTGLGLYIVKSIVDQIDGSIWFESEENEGSRFYVLLPLSGMEAKEGTRKLD